MAKKLTRSEKKLLKEWLDRIRTIEATCNMFYEDGVIAHLEFPAIREDTFDDFYNLGMADIKREPEKEQQVREAMKRKYDELHQNVEKGVAGNVEVSLDKGIVYSMSGECNIGNAIALIGCNNKRKYIFLNAGDRFDGRIIIGGDPIDAYFVLRAKEEDRDSEENIVMIPLDEFHLIGFCDKEKSGEGDWVIVNYFYCDIEVACYHVDSFEVERIRDLLLNECVKAKEDKEKHSKNGIEDVELRA